MTPAPADLADKLEPCPFCGSSAHYFFDRSTRERDWAICDGCDAAEPVTTWNTRHASEAAATARAVALEEAALACEAFANKPRDSWPRGPLSLIWALRDAIRALATPGHREAVLERCARALSRRRYGSDAGFEEQGDNAVAVLRAEAAAVLKELGI